MSKGSAGVIISNKCNQLVKHFIRSQINWVTRAIFHQSNVDVHRNWKIMEIQMYRLCIGGKRSERGIMNIHCLRSINHQLCISITWKYLLSSWFRSIIIFRTQITFHSMRRRSTYFMSQKGWSDDRITSSFIFHMHCVCVTVHLSPQKMSNYCTLYNDGDDVATTSVDIKRYQSPDIRMKITPLENASDFIGDMKSVRRLCLFHSNAMRHNCSVDITWFIEYLHSFWQPNENQFGACVCTRPIIKTGGKTLFTLAHAVGYELMASSWPTNGHSTSTSDDIFQISKHVIYECDNNINKHNLTTLSIIFIIIIMMLLLLLLPSPVYGTRKSFSNRFSRWIGGEIWQSSGHAPNISAFLIFKYG